jgi:hypothetical protein
MKLYFVISIFFLTITNFCCGNQENVEWVFKKIPADDQEILERFFSHMIATESFGYVLFGYKPMILFEISSSGMCYENLKRKYNENLFKRDCSIWKKYESLFVLKNYIFRISDLGSSYQILFIHKKSFLNAIYSNIALFNSKLHISTNPEYILNEFETKEFSSINILNHEDLLGIVLGFGRYNSQLFERREELYQNGKYKPPYNFDKINEIYQVNLTFFEPQIEELTYIKLPYFVENKNFKESIQIQKNYLKAQRDVIHFCSQGQVLKPILKILTGSHALDSSGIDIKD